LALTEHTKNRVIACHDALRDGELSDRCFRAVANCTYDWESWHAPDGRLIWVNAAVERVTGYSPAECLAMDDYPLQMVDVDDRQRIAEMLEDAKVGGT
jgi:PAS domain-containing protein